MPVIPSTYVAPAVFRNPHVQTMYASYLRYVPAVDYERESIPTPDGESIVLDRLKGTSNNLVVICHGVAGNSYSIYVRAMAQAFTLEGWSAVAWNMRGRFCSRSKNKYHMGYTDDLKLAVDHILAANPDISISLVGFSMGGNIILKYLGELGHRVPKAIRSAVVYSVPIDVYAAGEAIENSMNRWLSLKVLREIQADLAAKRSLLESCCDMSKVLNAKSWKEFDEYYTAPLHNFRDYREYRLNASSKPFLRDIVVNTLLVSARDDPLLSKECFPVQEAEQNPRFFAEFPENGGHIGFLGIGNSILDWPEMRAIEFIQSSVKSLPSG